MALSNTFITIYDKALANGHAHECKNTWDVVEHGKDATMTHLEVNAIGVFWGFDQALVKGVKDTTTKMSSSLEDKDCDGIAFLTDNSEQEHLVFAELKSNFDIQKITGAFHQITMSFLKMHVWLSLCKDTFETKFLKPLLDKKKIQVKLSSFDDIRKLPFHDHICEKEVVMYLQLTDTPSDSQTTVSIF